MNLCKAGLVLLFNSPKVIKVLRPAHMQSVSTVGQLQLAPPLLYSLISLPKHLFIYLFVHLHIAPFHFDACLTKQGLTLGLIEMHFSLAALIRGLVCWGAVWPAGRNV